MKEAHKGRIKGPDFSTSDKKTRRHDLACQYLAQKTQVSSLLSTCLPRWHQPLQFRCCFEYPLMIKNVGYNDRYYVSLKGYLDLYVLCLSKSKIKRPMCRSDASPGNKVWIETKEPKRKYIKGVVVKGRGSWLRQHIELADRIVEWPKNHKVYAYNPVRNSNLSRDFLVIEVKITPITVGEILRQAKWYQQWIWEAEDTAVFANLQKKSRCFRVMRTTVHYFVVADFDFSIKDVKMLKNEGIYFLRLGQKFDNYVKKQKRQKYKAVRI